MALGEVIPRHILMVAGGVSMLGFAGYNVISKFRHPAWVGMRVGGRDLIAWSFVMATAHGAGLMLIPALLEIVNWSVPSAVAHEGHHVHGMQMATDSTVSLAHSLAAVGVHTAAMFAVAGAFSLVVHSRVGVDVIRHAWINMDLIWIGAMAIVGFITIGMGVWPSIAG